MKEIGANTFNSLEPIMKEVYGVPKKQQTKKRKRFNKLADILKHKGQVPLTTKKN